MNVTPPKALAQGLIDLSKGGERSKQISAKQSSGGDETKTGTFQRFCQKHFKDLAKTYLAILSDGGGEDQNRLGGDWDQNSSEICQTDVIPPPRFVVDIRKFFVYILKP